MGASREAGVGRRAEEGWSGRKNWQHQLPGYTLVPALWHTGTPSGRSCGTAGDSLGQAEWHLGWSVTLGVVCDIWGDVTVIFCSEKSFNISEPIVSPDFLSGVLVPCDVLLHTHNFCRTTIF